ncbi:HAD-IIB family hydrolase [Rothia sp. P6271]|uniref:HAD-IIB family hydrolase n=1 Tax=unclassified Rothia (in: high G+C Gram-positive bacteria) TaxID=2689056 RepID=UPI003AC25104
MMRLIASDLDGTVLGEDFRFRPRTIAALEAAISAGVEVVFVTGRPIRWLTPLHEQLAYDSYAICSNGAVVYHLGRGEIVSTSLTPMRDIATAHQCLTESFPEATFTLETLEKIYVQGEFEITSVLEGAPIISGDLSDAFIEEDAAVKYLIHHPHADPYELLERVQAVIGESLGATLGVKGQALVEIARADVHKGHTLERFAYERGIPAADVVAFGDMPNDAQMLLWAGEGYAMASGSAALIEQVGRTCPAFSEDGVAQIIEEFLSAYCDNSEK